MPASCHTAITETANDASIASDARPPETLFGSRRPSVALTRKPSEREERDERECGVHHHFSDVNASGFSDSRWRNSAMTIARPTAASAAATVMTKNMMICPSTSPGVAAERDERQVHGVQHDLDRQQDRDQVAPQEHAGRADGEQDRRHDQVVAERNHGSPFPARQHDRADHRHEDQDRRRLERERVVGEEHAARARRTELTVVGVGSARRPASDAR